MSTRLDTARLRLRDLETSDLDFVAEMLSHPEVMRHYPRPLGHDEALAWIERQRARYARDGYGLWLAVERSSGAPVGQVGLIRQVVEGQEHDEIGYLLHRPYWHRGFAREAALAVRDFAFQAPPRERLISLIRPANHPSRRVAEHLGMTVRGRVRHADREHLVYAVERASVRARLETRSPR